MQTFFSLKTAPQYTCELFLEGTEDENKFRVAFYMRPQNTVSIMKEMKEWVANNIVWWKAEGLTTKL